MSEATVDSVVEKVSNSAREAKERVKDSVSDAAKSVKSASHDAREASADALETVSDYVREHPLMTIGVAFAAGALIYSILRR